MNKNNQTQKSNNGWVKDNYPQLCICVGKSKSYVMRTQFNIIKLDKCLDRQFISPIVITVKKDQTVKLALDSKKINKFNHKNKHQMPNIDLLLDNIEQQSANSILNIRFAYRVFTNPVGQTNSGTMQFQFDWWQCYRNLPISNGILRPHGYASWVSKDHQSHT